MDTILVSDKIKNWQFLAKHISLISSEAYLTNPEYPHKKNTRIINLCNDYKYQSTGYYISLLAQARGHKVIPSVSSILNIQSPKLNTFAIENLQQDIDKTLKHLKSDTFELSIYFGQSVDNKYQDLAKKLYAIYPLPLLKVSFKKKNEGWQVTKISIVKHSAVPEHHYPFLQESAVQFIQKKRIISSPKKPFKYSLAILYNPDEPTPPSDQMAIQKFIKAGEKLGIACECIKKNDYRFIAEYDGLFIRETTSVNHYTYKFARKAYNEGLTVIDDPESILKCTNKVYLAELLAKNKINHPKTYIFSKSNWKQLVEDCPLPIVLKKPDSAFSQGVVKVEDKITLANTVAQFFQTTEMVIAQSFLPTDYDWRIGILNQKPIYACKYYMAKNHWQIVNWHNGQEKVEKEEGEFETMDIKDVPDNVLKLALKATKIIGHGLYGVDLKQVGDKVYVIEVNDNPSIDYGVEDKHLGNHLYEQIMQYFLDEMTNAKH